jgi:hypothetical protein
MSRPPHLPSGIRAGLDFLIDPHWSPQQALAVFELLGDLRARIWMHYGVQMQQLLREECSPPAGAALDDIDGAF